MNKQELIERIEGLKNIFWDKCEYVKIDFMIELVSKLDEPQKVTIPQFVADHLKKSKEVGSDLQNAMNSSTIIEEVDLWLYTDNNMDIFARAWLDGYEVEKEPKYIVKMKNIHSYSSTLKRDDITGGYFFGNEAQMCASLSTHTRKELEEEGFGEVFNSPLFEVEEVE